MRTHVKLTILALLITFSLGIISTSFAADNTAVFGGGFPLTDSDAVTITRLAQPKLLKAVYNGATCLASSDSSPACNTINDTTITQGTTLTFVVYVANESSITLNDVRFNDLLDSTVGDGFTYVADSLSYGQAVAVPSWVNARATAFTNINATFDDAADAGDPVFYNVAAPTFPTIFVGGTGVAGNNDTVNLAAGEIFAIAFNVTVL